MTSAPRRLVAITCALLLVVLWASTSGSTRIWRSSLDYDPATAPSTTLFGAQPPETVEPPQEGDEGADANSEADELAWTIMKTLSLGLLLVGLAWAAFTLRDWWRKADRARAPAKPTFDVLPDVRVAITDDAEAQMAALASGSPRNAIVACWVRLEDAVASIGLQRHPAETAAELTSRVLSRYAASPDAIDQLARLYREARFSTHALGEAERDRAIAALQRLHADLGLATSTTTSPPAGSG